MRASSRGFTIPEVLVAAGLMGLLSAVCFAIYAMGLRSWTKIDAKTEVMSTLQLVQGKIAREVRSSQLPSVSVPVDNSGVAFLSAGPESTRQVDGGGRLQWQNFVLYYHDSTAQSIHRTEEIYTPADPTLLNTLDGFSGQPLSSFKAGGQVVGRDVDRLQATLENPDILRLVLHAQVGKEQMELVSSYQLNP